MSASGGHKERNLKGSRAASGGSGGPGRAGVLLGVGGPQLVLGGDPVDGEARGVVPVVGPALCIYLKQLQQPGVFQIPRPSNKSRVDQLIASKRKKQRKRK